jgi:Mg2+ and Co2+ transporter CorA
MSKTNELKLYQRDWFEKEITEKLTPEIEREELKIKTTVNKILDKGIKSFSKSIGADKVIARLEKAEAEKREASRLAYTFFNDKASSIVSYSKAKEYKFDRDEKDKISVDDCTGQLEKWAEKQAEQFAETTPQGQRLTYLKALQKKAKQMVMEANVSTELRNSLDNLFNFVGISWEQKLPALPKPKGK